MLTEQKPLSAAEAEEVKNLIIALEKENAAFQHRILELMAYMEEMTTQRVALEKELDALNSTRIMRLTQPLRRIYAAIRRVSE
jgi:predicted nuclease with TOPRIM domain